MEIKVSMPHVVYKYRIWDNHFHRRILENNELYFSDPRDFEDPFDCNPPIKYPEGHSLFIYILNYSLKHNIYMNYVEHIWFSSKMYANSPMAFPDKLKELKKEMDDEFNKHFGVLSLTEDCSNEHLWNEYANNHRGFCVGFDTQKLFDIVKGACGQVQYQSPLPSIDYAKDSLDEKIVKTVYYKEKKWEEEKEYRFHKLWAKNECVNRNVKLFDETIVEVILGKNMAQSDKNSIAQLVKAKYPKAVIKSE